MPTKHEGDIETVAREFLRHVKEQNGKRVPGHVAFKAAMEKEECRKLEWASHIGKTPVAEAAITRVIKRLMQDEDEFRDIEMEKRGPTKQARVFYRVRASATQP